MTRSQSALTARRQSIGEAARSRHATQTEKHTKKRKEKKTKRKKVEGGKGGDEEQACGRKAVKKQARQTDRWKDEKKKGPYHLASHPAGWTGPLCSFPVQTHLTAVCSLQQQCAHTHACTHTHTAACLTVGTITLLRGIDRGLKVKRMRCWKKIDNSHIQSPGPSSTHKSTQTNRSVVILPAWQPGMNLLSAVLNSSFICPIWSHTPHTHTTKNHTHKQLFGQGRTRSIVTQGKKGGGSGSPNSLSDCSHTPTQKRSVTQACTHTHTFSSAAVHDPDHTQTNELVLQGKKVPGSFTCRFIVFPTTAPILLRTVASAAIETYFRLCSKLCKVTAWIRVNQPNVTKMPTWAPPSHDSSIFNEGMQNFIYILGPQILLFLKIFFFFCIFSPYNPKSSTTSHIKG